jgi:RNA polymerase sigma-70 factor (ECF subfamily)
VTVAAAQLDQFRPALVGHCYRMLGSVVDAEDAVQEAMLRAWKGLDAFQERASLKNWLYRIATNVCLDTLSSAHRRRLLPLDLGAEPAVVRDDMALPQQPREVWIEPIPTAAVLPADGDSDPEERARLRESIRLAFVAALQYLPPRQRAALLLTQVLEWSAAEAAEALGMTVASVNSALQRARATLEARNPAVVPRELTAEQRTLLASYLEAFERYDVDALAALLHEEVTMNMPPYEMWLQGPASVARWFANQGADCRGSRIQPVGACGMAAFAQWRFGGAQAWAIHVLDLGASSVVGITSFLDVETLFPRFGLPLTLPG